MTNPSQLNQAGVAEFATSIAFGILATFTTLARLWIRIRSDWAIGVDDGFVILGLLSYYGLIAVNNWGTFSYGGVTNNFEPSTPGELKQLQNELKALYFAEIPFATGVTAIRLAALLLYIRLFPVRWIRVSAIVLGSICTAWWLMSIFVDIFDCDPISHFWNTEAPGSCLSTYTDYYLFKEIFATVLEAIIVFLPVRVLHTLNMNRRQKWLLTGVFLIGILVVVTNAVRAAVVFKPTSGFLSFTAGMTWSNVHLGVACTCVSLPSMRSAFSRLAAITSDGVQRYGYRLRSLMGSTASRDQLGSQNRSAENFPRAHLSQPTSRSATGDSSQEPKRQYSVGSEVV